MPADTYDAILGLILQGTGNNNNSWGTTQNNSCTTPTARAIAGVVTRSNTGGTLDLSGSPPPAAMRQDIDAIQLFNGVLASDLTVIVPNLSKLWWFQNSTTGSFNLYVKTTAGTATQIPQGVGRMVMCDGNNSVVRSDKDDIGALRLSAKTAAGAGELACNGASLLRASFPDLFGVISTTWGSADATHFTLPNFTDTGRFLRSSSGSLTVGTYQASQNAAHTHTITGTPAVNSLTTDSQGAHQHSVFLKDGGHSHTISQTFGGAAQSGAGQTGAGPPVSNTSTSFTGMTIGSVNGVANDNLTASAGAHTHTVTGTLTAGSLGTASSGGTEARPESAVVLMCIRY